MVWTTNLNAGTYFHLCVTRGFEGKPRRMSINNHKLENRRGTGGIEPFWPRKHRIKSIRPLHLHFRDLHAKLNCAFVFCHDDSSHRLTHRQSKGTHMSATRWCQRAHVFSVYNTRLHVLRWRWAVDCNSGEAAMLPSIGENKTTGLTGTSSGGSAAAVQEDTETKFCWSDFNLEFI